MELICTRVSAWLATPATYAKRVRVCLFVMKWINLIFCVLEMLTNVPHFRAIMAERALTKSTLSRAFA